MITCTKQKQKQKQQNMYGATQTLIIQIKSIFRLEREKLNIKVVNRKMNRNTQLPRNNALKMLYITSWNESWVRSRQKIASTSLWRYYNVEIEVERKPFFSLFTKLKFNSRLIFHCLWSTTSLLIDRRLTFIQFVESVFFLLAPSDKTLQKSDIDDDRYRLVGYKWISIKSNCFASCFLSFLFVRINVNIWLKEYKHYELKHLRHQQPTETAIVAVKFSLLRFLLNVYCWFYPPFYYIAVACLHYKLSIATLAWKKNTHTWF